jgi:hypothetical protein
MKDRLISKMERPLAARPKENFWMLQPTIFTKFPFLSTPALLLLPFTLEISFGVARPAMTAHRPIELRIS